MTFGLGLTVIFFLTALLYASVGFGGGSTYTAFLILAGTEYQIVPIVALSCNIVVVSVGQWRFQREKLRLFKTLLPFLITSIPAAWLGGRIPINESTFTYILGLCLLFAGLQMLWPERAERSAAFKKIPLLLAPIIGAAIGIVSGLVGIGGGIMLSPILYALRWGSARQIAGGCSLFILVNSVAALYGQLVKVSGAATPVDFTPYMILIPAVLLGGSVGSWFGAFRLTPRVLKRLTACVVLVAAFRLLWQP